MKQQDATWTHTFFPYAEVEAIPGHLACRAINKCMAQWFMPKRIKIDNGLPLANAGNRDIPTLTQLWWIGLGIEVRLNAIKVPQQNGTVENLQGTCHRWSAPSKYTSLEDYQNRLNETNRIQREVYRIRKSGDKTRKELYPELWTTPQKYDPGKFDIQIVYNNLAERVWYRTINKSGVIRFWKQYIYLGKTFIAQHVTITFDPIEQMWLIRAIDGKILKTYDKQLFTEQSILKHAGI